MHSGRYNEEISQQKRKQQEFDSFFQKKESKEQKSVLKEEGNVELEKESLTHYKKQTFLSWRAPEFEEYARDRKWYLGITAVLLAIIAYAIFTNGLIMAITFILIGMLGYIYIHKDPRILNFRITEDGIIAGREIYTFDNMQSFWIFYEEDGLQVISFHTHNYLLPYFHIPIHDQDPAHIREILLDYLPEEKSEPGAMEVLERILRL